MALSKHDQRREAVAEDVPARWRAGEPLSWCLDDPRDDAGTAWGLDSLMEHAEAAGDAVLLAPLRQAEAAMQRLLRTPAADECDWRSRPVTGEEVAEGERRPSRRT